MEKLAQYIAKITQNQTFPFELALRLGKCKILCKSNDAALIEELRHYFASFLLFEYINVDIVVHAIQAAPDDLGLVYQDKQPDPGKTRIKEEFFDLEDGRIVLKKLTGMLFLFGGETHYAYGPCIQNPNQVINFINNRYIQWLLDRGSLLLHASGVSLHNRGMAICGFAGMGKSTLALHIMTQGFSFVSNDRILLKASTQNVQMLGIPKLPRINPGTILNNKSLHKIIPRENLKKYRLLSQTALRTLEDKYDVFISEIYGEGHFKLDSNLFTLIILNWKNDKRTTKIEEIDLSERKDLYGAFVKSPGLFYQGRTHSYVYTTNAYLKLLSRVKVYEVTGKIDYQKLVRFTLVLYEGLK